MADWKQITARIRRARSGKDPAGQLSNLFSKTRDAMVAFELARYFESKGNNGDAGRWYLTAAERFRRADWKTKAQECASRLGATEAAEIPDSVSRAAEAAPLEPQLRSSSADSADTENEAALAVESEEVSAPAAEPETASVGVTEPSSARVNTNSRQRRGRRGGRDQRSARRASPAAPTRERQAEPVPVRTAREEAPVRVAAPESAESAPEVSMPASMRGRYGDPGLASRLSQLEMNFRRLLACPPCSLSDADKAPAGPGVWVLTDSDLSTFYYVEPCQTLRVAIPHLLRSSNARRGESIKPRLAEHLGIPEMRVSKYLSDHCVVRWLQMDEGAAHFAHFLIAVLHPALNE